MGPEGWTKVGIDTDVHEDGVASEPDAAASHELGWLLHFRHAEEIAIEAARFVFHARPYRKLDVIGAFKRRAHAKAPRRQVATKALKTTGKLSCIKRTLRALVRSKPGIVAITCAWAAVTSCTSSVSGGSNL